MGERVEVVGLMRFSLVFHNSYKKYWRVTRSSEAESITDAILEPKRLEARLRLVEQMPIASLAQQIDTDFRLCLMYSTLLADSYVQDLTALASRYSFIQLVPVAPDADFLVVCSSLISPDNPCVTFRLDDDDAVGPHLVEDLRRLATPGHEERVITFVNGVQMERRGRKLAFEQIDYPKLAIGLSFFTRQGTTIYDSGGHHKISEASIIQHRRPRAWIRSIHAASDSASRFKKHRSHSWLVAPNRATARLPEYAGIDFVAVAADLAPFDWRYTLGRFARRQAQRIKAIGRKAA